MNRSFHRPLIPAALALAALSLGLPSAHAAKPALTIQQRIDALLKRRINPEPLPVELPNPFQMSASGNLDVAENPAKEDADKNLNQALAASAGTPTPNSAQVLAECASHLKIGGIAVVNGQTQIAINNVLRKEGDVVMAEWNNSLVQLVVVRFLAGKIVLRYQDAETTLKF